MIYIRRNSGRWQSLRLYGIIDKNITGTEKACLQKARALLDAGIDLIQLRDKSSSDAACLAMAFAMQALARKKNIPFIINDRVDIAKIVAADGIHLGQDDIPIRHARALIGKKIIGKSCHSIRQAIEAEKEGVDYISIGPLFSTPLKPQMQSIGTRIITALKEKISIPFFAIGGINASNIGQLHAAGARHFAFCRYFLPAAVKPRVQRLREKIA